MARVTITRQEAERGLLPPVCALTGQPTDDVKTKIFRWQPGWISVLIVFGLLPYLVVALILRKTMTVQLPLVRAKHGHWLWREAVSWVAVLIALGVFFTGSGMSLSRDHEQLSGPLMLTGLGLFVVFLVVYLLLMRLGLHPTQITDRDITLAGVHQNFVDALEEERERDEEDFRREKEEHERDRERRRRRDRGEDDDQPRRAYRADDPK